MSEDQQIDNQDNDTATRSASTPTPATPTPAPNMIPKDRFDNVNKARKSAEQRSAELEVELAKYRQAEEQRKQDEAVARGEFETVLADKDATIAQYKTEAERAKELEEILLSTMESQISQIPEERRNLVPNFGPIKERLDWIDQNRDWLRKPIAPDLGMHDGSEPPPAPEPAVELDTNERFYAEMFGLDPKEVAKKKAAQ